jgi:hypothetical protein
MYSFKCINDFICLDKVVVKENELIEFEEYFESSSNDLLIKLTPNPIKKST